jgi:hypothetical protein
MDLTGLETKVDNIAAEQVRQGKQLAGIDSTLKERCNHHRTSAAAHRRYFWGALTIMLGWLTTVSTQIWVTHPKAHATGAPIIHEHYQEVTVD